MEKIEQGKYRIDGNNKLINSADIIIKKPLPATYYEKRESLDETSAILDEIIKDRSDKIDECVKDAKKYISEEFFTGKLCTIFLDVRTETMIEQLFDRQKQLFEIKPTPYLTVLVDDNTKTIK